MLLLKCYICFIFCRRNWNW